MRRFDKKELPFDKYKNNLLDYLRMQGIQAEIGQVRSCPWHEDSTPSFSVFTGDEGYPAFNCFGCGRAGDIYKAVEYCTGETNAKKQFEEIDRIFGTGEGSALSALPRPEPPEEKAPAFTADPAAFARFTDWLKSQPHASDSIIGYFAQRAQIKSEGYIHQYPQSLLQKLVPYFYWYPGKKAAEQALGKPALFAAGVPYAKKDEALPPEERGIAWWHSGVLAKSPEGYKLLFMDGIESKKINPRAGVSYFPVPGAIPEGKPAVLMEGEIDAILCHASGINAYSMGGKGGLTKERIKKYIIPQNLPEIILFADNDKDKGSQKKFGLLPITKGDHIRETVPENLRKMGYTGEIKVTVLPDECGFKDPDDAIRNNRLDLVQKAIAEAKPYTPPETPATPDTDNQEKKTAEQKKEEQIPGTIYKTYDTVPLKFFKSLLKKVPYTTLQADDVQPFLCAAYKTCRDDGATDALIAWCDDAFTESDLKKIAKEDYTPFHLLTLLPKYEASNYYRAKLEELLVPAKEILRLFKIKDTPIHIDYEKAVESKTLQAFLDKKGNFSAADFLAEVTDGNIIYVIEDKTNYAYNGLKWCVVPDLAVTAHDILQNILLKYLEKNLDQKDFINKVLTHIDSRRFRSELVRDFNGLEQIACGKSVDKEIMFDSLAVRATLTLADGVMDFSGEKLKFRKATRSEYRRSSLPYTVAEVKKAASPEKFLQLMQSNFKPADEETLKKNPVTTVETLMYYLSLIQSRDTSRRYGGFFRGTGGTGESTLLKIIAAIYPGCTTALNENLLVSVTKHFDNPNGPTPEMAKLEGMLFGYISETPERGKLNETIFKRLTGGDIITARTLHHEPHDFFQTAQIGIASNNSPSFSHSETAAIDRMMIFRFNVRHEKGLKESKTPEQLIEWLRPEFPAIIKYFAEKYIDLNINLKGKIPMSTECINEKGLYIDAQANDTDRFISLCIQFDMNSAKAFIPSKDLYSCYLLMLKAFYNKEFLPDSKETPSQRQFTTWLKTRVEFQNTWKQQRVEGSEMPEWGFEHVAFTDYALKLMQTQPPQDGSLNFGSTPPQPDTTTLKSNPPQDDPFADLPDEPDTDPLTDEDGNEIDIF